jgi:hypothetical protein
MHRLCPRGPCMHHSLLFLLHLSSEGFSAEIVFCSFLHFVSGPALQRRLPTMENELDLRLARLQLEQYRSVTDRTANDCLFLAAIARIREYA